MSQGAALDPDYVTSSSEVEYCLYVWDAHHNDPYGHHHVSLSSSNCDDATVVRRLPSRLILQQLDSPSTSSAMPQYLSFCLYVARLVPLYTHACTAVMFIEFCQCNVIGVDEMCSIIGQVGRR